MNLLPRILNRIRVFFEYIIKLTTRIYCRLRNINVVHFIHNYKTNNAGDRYCSPLFYYKDTAFKNFYCIQHDINFVELSTIFKDDYVIVGGGGLINCVGAWNNKLNLILAKSKKVVFWGGGFNQHYGRPITPELDIKRFASFGIRDFNLKYKWVPCVSCKIEALSRNYDMVRKIGIVSHIDFNIADFKNIESINNYQPIDKILKFIGESEYIITSSYHAMYWATLMGKKVILYTSFSEKFDNFPWPPRKYSGNLEDDMSKCKIYPNALKDARDTNDAYSMNVMEIFS